MPQRSKRESILASGLGLVHRRGFAATGVAAIAGAARAPKGSFYNHFESKDAFGVEVLDRYFETVRDALAATLGDASRAPLQRIDRYFRLLRELGEPDHHARGCLIGNLAAEASPSSPALRDRLRRHLDEWTTAVAACLAEAQERGELPRAADVHALATVLLDAWQGAVLRAKVVRSDAPMVAFLDVLLPALLGRVR